MKASGLHPAILLLLMCFCTCESPEDVVVDIPDAAFLQALIDRGVDLNADGAISLGEAEAVDSLVIGPYGITNLTGLASMNRLKFLDITLNPLVTLDVSANSELRYLACTSCDLNQLDLGLNVALTELHCGRNHLEELVLENNVKLTRLSCNNNLLESLELEMNTSLVFLISCGNRLTFLDLSNNSSLEMIGIDNMPMLEEVCVWTLPFPPSGVNVLMEYSPSVRFSTGCTSPL